MVDLTDKMLARAVVLTSGRACTLAQVAEYSGFSEDRATAAVVEALKDGWLHVIAGGGDRRLVAEREA